MPCRSRSGANQRAPEWQYAIAIARGAFAEQDHRVAVGEASCNLGVDLGCLLPLRSIDEYRALQLCEQPEQRPARDLQLGDEAHGSDRRNHRDVEP